jgi:glyoxalase family protein
MAGRIRTNGINHPALVGTDRAATLDFYTRVLGMRLVLDQPNLDVEWRDHLFFEAGPGQFVAYFVPKDGETERVPPNDNGHLAHLALNLATPIEDAVAALHAEGVEVEGPVDRGYERSIYFKDPNGVIVELLTWITPVPDGWDEGDLIAAAQQRRVARGARAIEQDDIDVVLGDAS